MPRMADCHPEGQVRGLLCDPCNLAVDHLDDDIDRALALVEYLKYWKEKESDES